MADQRQSAGAEALAWEVCKLLDAGREREMHCARTHGALTALAALAAGPADGSVADLPRRSTQVAALRALLAACALPCNRAYLLLCNHAAALAATTLPAAVGAARKLRRQDGVAVRGPDAAGPGDALLLPLLKLLRLIIATPPPAESAHRMRADLVTLLLYSGGLHSLQDHCTSLSATPEQAADHQPLLLQYVALVHSLLLPLRASAQCSCAAPLRAFLQEAGVSGCMGIACSILCEGAGQDAQARSAALPAPMLEVCRSVVLLLVHLGSLDAPYLRRVLGGGELKVQTLHLAHLTLQMCEGAHERASGLLHDVLLLLALFALGSRANSEVLRWRWRGHPTMLHRLCALPFPYFCEARLRAILMPTLVCGCLHDAANLRILSSRLSAEHLRRFLREQLRLQAAAAVAPCADLSPAAVLVADPSELPIVSLDYSLACRLHPAMWSEALAFFEAARPPTPPAAA